VRYGNLTTNEAETLVVDLAALPLIIVSSSALLKRSLQIGLSNQLAVYDSAYIALAEMLGCPLITADSKQGTAAKSVGVQLKPLTDFAP
jgi:predicted nucleic acid-binding protein